MLRRITLSAFVLLAAACRDAAAPGSPLVVDVVDLSSVSLTFAPAATQTLVATARTLDGTVVPGKTATWSSSDPSVAAVASTGRVQAIALGTATITATIDSKSAEAKISVVATQPAHLASNWRMESFDGTSVPGAYATYYNQPVGDRIVGTVEIRLDSAINTFTSAGRYQRSYYFTELQDGVVAFRYGWGDHGIFTLGPSVPVSLRLDSEWIQNVMSTGQVRADGRVALSEELWLGEAKRATVWTRR